MPRYYTVVSYLCINKFSPNVFDYPAPGVYYKIITNGKVDKYDL